VISSPNMRSLRRALLWASAVGFWIGCSVNQSGLTDGGGLSGDGATGAGGGAGGVVAGRGGSTGAAGGAAGSIITGTGGGAGVGGSTGTGGGSGNAGSTGNGGARGNGGAQGSGGAMGSGGVDDGGAPSGAFGYMPTNFDPAGLDGGVSAGSATVLDCGVSTFDSETLTFGNWCGQNQPAPAVRTQPSGPDVVVIPFQAFTVAKGATLKLTGTRPVILAVFGDAIVEGTVDASASGSTPGAGGNQSCGTSQGGNGSGDPSRNDGASGGGGGGFGTAGGDGGLANTDGCCGGSAMRNVPGGTGGVARGAAGLVAVDALVAVGRTTVDIRREDVGGAGFHRGSQD